MRHRLEYLLVASVAFCVRHLPWRAVSVSGGALGLVVYALDSKRRDFGFMPHGLYGDSKPLDEILCQYYLRIPVDDKPGVLAQVAGVLGSLNIGISSMIQPESDGQSTVLILMLHDATHAQVREALSRIIALPPVKGKPMLLRVEHFSA